MGRTIRVMVVDDHPMFRQGVITALSREADIEVVGEAASAREALDKAALVLPDVVVMDLQMPGMSGIEATRAIKQQGAGIHVIVLTVNEAEPFLMKAIQAGAAGYVLKGASSRLLVDSIRIVTQGGNVLPAGLFEKAVAAASAPPPAEQEPPAVDFELTRRELEVLRLVGRGFANRDIARELEVAVVTVKKHMQNVLFKMGVHDRTQAALKAVRLGLLD